jgi:hypothetical protein
LQIVLNQVVQIDFGVTADSPVACGIILAGVNQEPSRTLCERSVEGDKKPKHEL